MCDKWQGVFWKVSYFIKGRMITEGGFPNADMAKKYARILAMRVGVSGVEYMATGEIVPKLDAVI